LSTSKTTYIGLGSNLDNPIQQVQLALHRLAELPDTQLCCHSSLYRSVPLGAMDQPDYINAVAKLETTLSALQLLSELQQLEIQQGRVRTSVRWSARTLDLDILLYNQMDLQDPRLTLPHPGLTLRNFVLYPLYECEPDLILPNGQVLQTMIQERIPQGLEKLLS